jgi:thiol-disulfide isomerase/thioredoxin
MKRIIQLIIISLTLSFALANAPQKLPDFSLKSIDDKTIRSTSFNGKYVIINFWATWCPPCRKEMPDFIEFQKAHKDDVVILAISLDRKKNVVKPYADKTGMNFPVLYGSPEVADLFGGIASIPQTFIYDSSGKLVKHFTGMIGESDLKAVVK